MEVRINMRTQLDQVRVRFVQVLADRSIALVKIRNCIQTETVDSELQPEIEDLFDQRVDGWVIKIQIRLVRIKTMPVIRLCNRIPRPVRRFEIFKDDPRFRILFWGVAPDV